MKLPPFFFFLQAHITLLATASELRGGRNLIDPKTVEAKKEDDYSKLKYLVLGTSRSFGVQMEHRLEEAYSFLLSPDTVNLAVPGGGPRYPYDCLYTLLHSQSDAFDVMILEFPVNFFHFTMQLAWRLRQRYPNALIMFLDVWTPQNYHTTSEKYRRIVDDTEKEAEWTYDPIHSYSSKEFQQIEEVGGVWTTLPRPADPYEAMAQFGHHYLPDLIHYSKTGHEVFAKVIRDHLATIHFRTNHDSTLQPWDHLDICESWFQTGETDLQHDSNLVMNQFREGKFALETRKESWVSIPNDTGIPLQLSIAFMATSPDCLTPPTRLSLMALTGQDSTSSTAEVTTSCRAMGFSSAVQVKDKIQVGMVPPGGAKMRVQPLEDTEWPFRFVGLEFMPVEERKAVKSS